MMTAKDFAKEAMFWAKQGVPVFPTAENKAPLTANGHKDASTDKATIYEMFERAGSSVAGIGAAMGEQSGLFAIDADTYKDGAAGQAAKDFVSRLEREGLLPHTRVHKTQSGGTHYILYSDEAWPNMKPCAGVEVKGEGGYIIVPPTPNYTVVSEGLATAPAELIAELQRGKSAASAQSVKKLKANIMSAEDFHDSLTMLSAKLSAQGWSAERVQNELLNTLTSSVARMENHPRHARWQQLTSDDSGEFSRIVASGDEKFNMSGVSDRLRAAAQAAGHAFDKSAPPPVMQGGVDDTAAVDAAIDDVTAATGEEWPFAGDRGYFGTTELDVLSQKYVMHPILAEEETTLISAAPKAGKTLVTETLGLHIAAGMDLGELKVFEKRPVIYLALESQTAIRKRMVAWKQHHNIDTTDFAEFPFFVLERPYNMLAQENRLELATKVAKADKYFQANDLEATGLIVIDTLTKAMAGGDQNSVEDTSSVFELVADLRTLGVTAPIVFVHHTKKDDAASPRGSSNIQAEPDTLLSLQKAETGELVLSVALARSIEDDHSFAFAIETEDLGVTAQGYHITAPVLSAVTEEHRADTAASERVVNERTFDMVAKEITKMGVGEHSAQAMHDWLKQQLGPQYPLYEVKLASTDKFAAYFTGNIPLTGRNVESGKYNLTCNTRAKVARTRGTATRRVRARQVIVETIVVQRVG